MDKDIAVIGDKDRIDWHLDGSTLSLKVPEMEGLRTWSLISQTCMAGHIVRNERRGVVLQVRGRCNKGGSVVSTDANCDHVLSQQFAISDAHVEASRDDVCQAIIYRQFNYDLRIVAPKLGELRHDEHQRCRTMNTDTDTACWPASIVRKRRQACPDLDESGPQPVQQLFSRSSWCDVSCGSVEQLDAEAPLQQANGMTESRSGTPSRAAARVKLDSSAMVAKVSRSARSSRFIVESHS
jgi:hypothetical protein